jgi:mono/diheme cytochrome c family protein
LSCHTIEGRGATYAPDLTSEGSRLHEDWIAQFVESPDIVRPLSQQMPKLNLTTEEATIIASYMSTDRHDARIPGDIPGAPITLEDIERGRAAFQARGCFACHTSGEGSGGVVGPDLQKIGDRMQPGAIWFHIKNPHAVNQYSAEPDYGLTDDEARALAAFLSTRKQ